MKIDVGVRFGVSPKSINTPPSLDGNCSKHGARAKPSLICAGSLFLTSLEEHRAEKQNKRICISDVRNACYFAVF